MHAQGEIIGTELVIAVAFDKFVNAADREARVEAWQHFIKSLKARDPARQRDIDLARIARLRVVHQ